MAGWWVLLGQQFSLLIIKGTHPLVLSTEEAKKSNTPFAHYSSQSNVPKLLSPLLHIPLLIHLSTQIPRSAPITQPRPGSSPNPTFGSPHPISSRHNSSLPRRVQRRRVPVGPPRRPLLRGKIGMRIRGKAPPRHGRPEFLLGSAPPDEVLPGSCGLALRSLLRDSTSEGHRH